MLATASQWKHAQGHNLQFAFHPKTRQDQHKMILFVCQLFVSFDNSALETFEYVYLGNMEA